MSAVSTNDVVSDTQFGFIDRHIEAPKLYNPALFDNSAGNTMYNAISRELARATHFEFAVAFITTSALALLKEDLLNYRGTGIIYTSTYLDFNEPSVFEELMELSGVEVRVLQDPIDAFHVKGYIFYQGVPENTTTAIIGSTNLTRSALYSNTEWNLKFSALSDGQIIEQLQRSIAALREHSIPLTREWISQYEKRRRPLATAQAIEHESNPIIPVGRIEPNAMQAEALAQIADVQSQSKSRALVISATGTGKTILAALAVRQARPQRMLFVVHREQILSKAIEEFQKSAGLRASRGIRQVCRTTPQPPSKVSFCHNSDTFTA